MKKALKHTLPQSFYILIFILSVFCQHDPAPLFIAGNPVLQDLLYPIVFKIILIFGIFDLL